MTKEKITTPGRPGMQASSNKIMIVDDDEDSRRLLRAKMATMFDVVTCSSGEEALATVTSIKPDLILMDVEMPRLDGYETCRQLRQNEVSLPIIFVTAHQSLEEHLKAYDAGGDDLITKPVDFDILYHKAVLAIRQKSEKEKLVLEAQSLQNMAMNFLSSAEESGVLLKFVRKAVAARSYQALAQDLVDAIRKFDLQSNVLIRYSDSSAIATSHGESNNLERSILENMSGMGRLFQFQRQLVVNGNHVSVMVSNAPQDSTENTERMHENIATLTETAEALCENVHMRLESMARAEQLQIALIGASHSIERLRKNHHQLLLDTRILLQELIDSVESTYSWLNTTRGQEEAISGSMDKSVQKILALLATGDKFDQEINNVLDVLRGKNPDDEIELW